MDFGVLGREMGKLSDRVQTSATFVIGGLRRNVFKTTQPSSDSNSHPTSDPAGTSSNTDDREKEAAAAAASALAAAPQSSNNRAYGQLMALPPEIQLMIVRKLEFSDIERLRRTCHFYRNFISPKTVRELFKPNFKSVLLAHCFLCLKHDHTRSGLLWADWADWRYPLSSKCIDCAQQAGEFTAGKKVSLGNYASVWICRWCGRPIFQDAAWNQPEFHRGCYRQYNDVLLVFFGLGWLQFAIVVVGGALCWRYFREEKLVLIPSIVSRCSDRVHACVRLGTCSDSDRSTLSWPSGAWPS